MQANNFYGANGNKKHSASGVMLNQDSTPVFSAGGGTKELVNTAPARGFRSAVGNFYGADGDTSQSAAATTAATPSTTTSTTPAPANPTPSLGLNIPTVLVLLAGVVIGYVVKKQNIIAA